MGPVMIKGWVVGWLITSAVKNKISQAEMAICAVAIIVATVWEQIRKE